MTQTREEMLEELALLEEAERRAKNSRALFTPNAGQMPVMRSRALVRFVASANGAGKTALACMEALWAAEGWNPIIEEFTSVPATVIVVLDKADKADSIWIPELQKWAVIRGDQLKKKGKPYTSEIWFDNGSRIVFMSHEMEPLAFEGIQCDFVIFDEPCPKFIYTALRRAGRKVTGAARYLIVGTPLAHPWLRTDIWEPWSRGELKDVECFRTGAEVNAGNLPPGFLESFSAALSDKERAIRMRGEFHDLEGLALAHLIDRAVHVIPAKDFYWEKSWPCVMVIDPHPRKKHHAVLMGADRDGQIIIIDEMAHKLVAREFAEKLRPWLNEYRVIDIVSDSLGSQDTTGGEGFKSFIQVLRECGILARATSYEEKEDEAFISRIQDALLIPEEKNNFGARLPKLRLHERCRGTLNNLENVQWVVDKRSQETKPKLDISNQDYLSCVKYGLATNLSIKKGKDKAYYVTKRVYGADLRPKKLMVRYNK